MAEKGYGEIKARAKIFPSDIDKFSEQGVSLVLVQAKASPKTKQRAEAKGIKLYDDLSPEKVKEVREKDATKLIEKAVKGMLQHNTLGDQQFTKLKVYCGPEHPHAAQKPIVLEKEAK